MPGCEASGSRNASRVAVVYALKDKDSFRVKARKVSELDMDKSRTRDAGPAANLRHSFPSPQRARLTTKPQVVLGLVLPQ